MTLLNFVKLCLTLFNLRSYAQILCLLYFWPLGQDNNDYCFRPVYMFGENHISDKSPLPESGFTIFKVKNQNPSDIMHFLGETKSKKKS